MKQVPYVLHPQRTQIALAYRNDSTDYIADSVLPRVPTAEKFTYNVFDKGTFLKIPDSKPIGRKGAVPEITGTGSEVTASTNDYAIDESVPVADIAVYEQGLTNINPEEVAAMRLSDYLLMQREYRVASLITAAGTYASGNSIALTGSNKWSDTSSDPQKAILTQMDKMFKRPNTMVMGQTAATALQTHPKILQAWHGNDGSSGVAPLTFLAQLFGMKEVLVGQAWGDTAAPGQTSVISRLWGDSVALLYKNPLTVDTRAATFGFTAMSKDLTSLDYFDMKKGAEGSNVQRLLWKLNEVIVASDFGYLFQTTT